MRSRGVDIWLPLSQAQAVLLALDGQPANPKKMERAAQKIRWAIARSLVVRTQRPTA